jgi:CheY-like chemotaxis protein
MAALPRIITVDPIGSVSRIVRAAVDLLDLPLVQIDVPDGSEALAEAPRASLIVAAYELDEPDAKMTGFQLAQRIQRASGEAGIIVIADVDGPEERAVAAEYNGAFAYFRRPLDGQQFLRVLAVGISEGAVAMKTAMTTPVAAARSSSTPNAPIPPLDLSQAQAIIDGLLTDLGAMAIILASRNGETLLERGAVGYIDRERLTKALMPIMTTNIGVKDLFGGQVSTVQFYDGEDHDVFVLSVGLHHFVCVMYDGQQGARQFGLVNRFGRRAVEDLIGLVGANAFFIQMPVVDDEDDLARARPKVRKPVRRHSDEDDEPIVLAPAELIPQEPASPPPQPVAKPAADPIANLNPDELFGQDFDELTEDLFDPDKLEEIARQSQQTSRSTIDWDQAVGLDILKN